MKKEYFATLRCATCGCDDKFEYNDDKSYIKCVFCNREYFGGIEELQEYNQDVIENVKENIETDIIKNIREKFKKSLKGNNYVKIK